MEFNNFDINREYFLMSIHFVEDAEYFGLKKINETEYLDKETGEKYYRMPGYDFGWGDERCWVLDRIYSFDDLIKLALHEKTDDSMRYFNELGAVNLIMQGSVRQKNMIPELIAFVKNNVLKNCTLSDYNFTRLGLFFYEQYGEHKNAFYLELLEKYPEWREIKNEVLALIEEKHLFLKKPNVEIIGNKIYVDGKLI